MINMRMNALNESTTGEPEQDANSALIELDKGLRSTKIGEQCEAIVRYPKLFEKYPFPILINSSLLKLADVFRVGTNFLRVWVLRVFQQSEKHLDKILNVDEFVKRIYSVMHSNDPIAKALTLRTLGSVARIIPERKHVHHSIRKSLDCHDLVQVEAAIYAAQMFAAQSKQFAIFMCSKISDMIRGQATPAKMKLQLIPILQYMHHDISTASMANELCLELLESYPAVEFSYVTLSASTTLASATLINVSDQVTLLLRYLRDDPRSSIKTHALKLLHSLAGKGAHLWPQGALNQLIDSTATLLQDGAENINLLIRSLNVIEVLSESPVTCEANIEKGSPLITLCSKACYSPNPIVAVKAVTILARIACYCYEEGLTVYGVQDVVSCLESLIMLLALEDKYLYQLKVCLQLTVKLSQAQRSHCSDFVDAIGSSLMNTNPSSKQSNSQEIALCEALGAIGSLGDDILLPLLPDVLAKLKRTSHNQTKVMLCNLLFQMVAGGYEWSSECLAAVSAVSKSVDNWNKYRIARGAARYGHHKIATRLFKGLKESVASEQLHFWLLGLELLTSAESYLLDEIEKDGNTVSKLNGAICQYAAACTSFKAATSNNNLQFVCDYAKLRCEFLQALVQLLHSCRSLCTAPPYAIAAHEAHTAKDELQRYGRVTSQLRKSVDELKTCANNYHMLYQSAFDADPGTLTNIRALQELCLLMAHSVQRVCGGPMVSTSFPLAADGNAHFGDTIEMQQLAKCCSRIQELAPAGDAGNETSSRKTSGVSHLRVGSLISQVRLLASGKLRLPVPRFFFQALQSTSIKLSLSPQPRVLGEPVSVPQGSQLALKVEGVLRHGKRPSLFRSVAAVSISISTAPPSKLCADKKDTGVCELEQSMVPSRDFFTCEFLLSLGQQNSTVSLCSANASGGQQPTSSGGQYQVTASANIVDEVGNIWKCGPRSLLQVRVHEEPSRKKLS
ncbi:integrator complex subunit 7 [Phymastichus coffea]|uniref:integrator complex subunit 7 n=1 Tax=Phymastichus coffea TaxID=108790 RepID=UPI00273C2D52|nr:integrator complex subunit 7 [Phymastichus coffea]XP_058793914.1 integrator complex subunit 7 [Phymastichus coffea]XP_058793915.1 integrator complex subunit 7 [Phymastichus coffea]XP_058793916.1 integrator complex subunit 7 [Phymastichus coffea]